MKFTKMHGCGNDYIYVDGAREIIPAERKSEVVKFLSDRHFGIGGDGVIFINPSDVADFEMEMYNMDGSRSEMCGNGIRCVGKYVYDHGLTRKTSLAIVSCGKIKYLELTVEDGRVTKVRVNMGSPVLEAAEIPVVAKLSPVVDIPITVDGREYRMTCVSMGNPHAVIFSEEINGISLEETGRELEFHPRFPERANIEFCHVTARDRMEIRVWERGVGETLACGTGACAAVVASVLNDLTDEEVIVKLLGGELSVRWDRKVNHVFLEGPAVKVFDGVL